MSTDDLIARFIGADTSRLPPIENCGEDPTTLALWVLWAGRDAVGEQLLTPGEISAVLRDVYGRNVPRQRLHAALSSDRSRVARRRKSKRYAFQIMDKGLEAIAGIGSRAILVEPEKALSRVREVQSIFAEFEDALRICDPYVDPRTLDFLAECRSASEIRLLSSNVRKSDTVKRDLKPLMKQLGIPVEIRVSQTGVLHDRYVIHKDGLLLVGTSLNGLGLKQSFVVAAGVDLRGMALQTFDQQWGIAQPL